MICSRRQQTDKAALKEDGSRLEKNYWKKGKGESERYTVIRDDVALSLTTGYNLYLASCVFADTVYLQSRPL